MNSADTLADALNGSRDWTLKLIADIADDEWTHQPQPGMQHILWLCGHLAVAERLLVQIRCLDGADADPDFTAHFPIGGPVKSVEEHDYPSPEIVRAKMDEIHAQVLSAIRGMSEAQLDEPCYGKDGSIHPHYKTKRQAIAHCIRHEGFHAGQIAILRRLMGKPFLR